MKLIFLFFKKDLPFFVCIFIFIIFIKIYIFINKHEIELKSGVLQINCVDERDIEQVKKKTLINHFNTHAHIVIRLRNYAKKSSNYHQT